MFVTEREETVQKQRGDIFPTSGTARQHAELKELEIGISKKNVSSTLPPCG